MSDKPKPKYRPTDSILAFEDAEAWAHELIPLSAEQLVEQLLHDEPAAAGIALNFANRVRQLARSMNMRDSARERFALLAMKSGLIAALMMRRAYRNFLTDLIDPPAEELP